MCSLLLVFIEVLSDLLGVLALWGDFAFGYTGVCIDG